MIALLCGAIIFLWLTLNKTRRELMSLRQLLHDASQKSGRLEEQNRTKDKLLSILSHDLRGPVKNLRAIVELIGSRAITQQEFHGLTDRFGKDIQRSEAMMDDVLNWMSTQRAGLQTTKEAINIRLIAYEVKMLALPNADAKDIKILYEANEEVFASADRNHVHIILRNLLNNAVKFSRPSSVVSITSNTENEWAWVLISDQGLGMNEDDVKKFMANEAIGTRMGTANEKGSGFGLTICRELIHQNGGQLSIASEQGVGTTFAVRLPLAKP